MGRVKAAPKKSLGRQLMQQLDLMAAIRNVVQELNDILDQLAASDTVELVTRRPKEEITYEHEAPGVDPAEPEVTTDWPPSLGEQASFNYPSDGGL